MKLRDYQETLSNQSYLKLIFYKICYLAMEVRTGKTLTSLATCEKYFKHTNIQNGSVLFITTKKAIDDIENQAKYVDIPYFTCINYESTHKLENKYYDVIICDEAHKLGAFPKPSNRVKNLLGFNTLAYIFLSGTPSPESYSQLYHQFYITKQHSPFKEYKNFYKWAKDYVNVNQKRVANGFMANDYSDAKYEDITEKIDKYFIRFTQNEAGFETKIKEQIEHVQMKEITYNIANKLLKEDIFEGNNNVILADTSVKKQSKLHQIYSGTIKFEDGTHAIIDKSKAEFIKQKYHNKKIAIFYKFKAEYELLKTVFENHTTIPSEFNESDKLIFLGQIQSVREGINLSTADCLIMYNIDFSAVSYWQGRDRLSEKNRTKENIVIWVFSKDGIEDKIYHTVKSKKDYTLKHFKKDYERAENTIKNNKTFRGQRLLFD